MIPWDNYIMRKYGQSIRKQIIDAYYPFAYGVAIILREKKLDRTLEELPDRKWAKS